MDGEETDFETLSETVNGNPKDFLYFLLPPELAGIFPETENKEIYVYCLQQMIQTQYKSYFCVI